jgi:hypothetical protein
MSADKRSRFHGVSTFRVAQARRKDLAARVTTLGPGTSEPRRLRVCNRALRLDRLSVTVSMAPRVTTMSRD